MLYVFVHPWQQWLNQWCEQDHGWKWGGGTAGVQRVEFSKGAQLKI